ncbi:ChaN family lipoprotein [Flavobacterium capsici]|uniref:ChaN family lipoprotein n=1 Tax=Flavobacterium capsici TaxID=3075618 RepID=A0AA96J9V7_9FLAO|nr:MULTISPECIES: ChaN family lipoprotein [unclassified Flavobacterium]WNM19550.1 ChaN family lipoprotein [Flavobacterium sp. PMR2A8]WNM20939.1 ChaN family lipoprotein [Flavobacterium sp. PMTSA4]
MKNILTTLLLVSLFGFAQDKSPYQLFDKNGKKVRYKKLLKSTENADVVLFGEYHNNSIVHWLQLELTKDLAEKKQLILGAEMLEADNQKQVNQYLAGEINQKQLDSTARLWNNYKTDYKPLVDFAKEKKLKFIATNIPRRYASLVFKKDFQALDNLTDEEKSWIAPLPIPFDINLPGYKSMMEMAEHAGEKMPKAQAIKDATMAHFIVKNFVKNSLFIHFNGTYHSDNFEGINWYLKKYNPELKILTISTVEQSTISKLDKENYTKADYILVIDIDATKTY